MLCLTELAGQWTVYSAVMQIPISFMDNVGVSSQEPLTLAKISFIMEKKMLT